MIGDIITLPVQRIFSGGQAPNRWQRHLRQRIAWLSSCHRASAWLETAVLTQRPRLVADSLMGHSLAELTGWTAAPAGAEPEPVKPDGDGSRSPGRSQQRPETLLPVHRRSQNHEDSRKPKPNRPANSPKRLVKPGRLQTEADRALLHCLAGATTVSTQLPHLVAPSLMGHSLAELTGRTATPVGAEPEPARSKGDSLRSYGRSQQRPETPTRVAPLPNDAVAARPAYIQTLSRRAGYRLHQRGMNDATQSGRGIGQNFLAAGSRETDPNRLKQDNTRDSPRENDLRPKDAPTFAAQWAWPLTGPTASESLLTRLVRQAGGPDENNHATVQRANGRTKTAREATNKPASPATLRPGEMANITKTPPPAIQSPILTGQDKPTGTATPSQMMEQTITGMEEGGGREDSRSPVMPPQATPTLPDLGPPRQVWEPILPLAARMSQQNAREARATAVDDLQELANKVKRILDEEARRFGIDV